jgi:SAM-dependent methyltransferase
METEAFTERLFESMLGAFDTLTVHLGGRLGLYDALHQHGPLTPPELAERAGIHPRYAREWLEQQTVSGVLTVDDPATAADQRRYSLPAEHAAALADEDDLAFFRPFLDMVAAAAVQMPALVEAYRTGGGVPWHQYGEQMRLAQARANRPLFLDLLGREWLPALPDVHERLTAGGRVADIGCGEGWSAIGMALAYPAISVDGYDIDKASVDAANAHAAEYGLAQRVRFHHVDGAVVDRPDGYDLVTAFECIHDMGDPVAVLSEMRELVGAGGTVMVMDERVQDAFTGEEDPVERLFYGYSTLVCLPDGLSHVGSVGTGTVMRPDTLRGYARSAGFRDVDVLPIEHETFRFYRLVA